MITEDLYKSVSNQICSIFQELVEIVESLKDNFDEESKQDSGLNLLIVDDHLGIVEKYRDRSKNFSIDAQWTLDNDIRSKKNSLRSFRREFDNPFLGSQKWYQRIIQLQDQLSEQSRNLDELIEQD